MATTANATGELATSGNSDRPGGSAKRRNGGTRLEPSYQFFQHE
ncbi:hypothetical protein [Paraburkholderia sp. GAS334]